jgi:hypothetical protein
VEKWLLPCGCSHIFIIEILLNNYLGSKNSKWVLKMKPYFTFHMFQICA